MIHPGLELALPDGDSNIAPHQAYIHCSACEVVVKPHHEKLEGGMKIAPEDIVTLKRTPTEEIPAPAAVEFAAPQHPIDQPE